MSKSKYTVGSLLHYTAQMLLKIVTLSFTLTLTWPFLFAVHCFKIKTQFTIFWFTVLKKKRAPNFVHSSHKDKYNVLYIELCPSLLTLSFCVTLNFDYFPICFHLSLQHCKLRSLKIQNPFFHVVIGMIISYGHTSMGLYNLRQRPWILIQIYLCFYISSQVIKRQSFSFCILHSEVSF